MRKWLRRIVIGAVVGIPAAIGLLLLFLWIEHRWTTELPRPTGPFLVGRTIQDWTDTHEDALAPTRGTKRELLVWIWYPAAAGPSVVIDTYVPAQLRPKPENSGGTNIWTLLTLDPSRVRGHSAGDAAVSPQQRSYPVVLLRAGASSGVLNYSTLAEDLASHGYIVVGFDAPYRTNRVIFPDGRVMGRTEENNPETCLVSDRAQMEQCVGRVLGAWTGDMGFVLDRLALLNASDSTGMFTGRLDLERVGVFGHSLGGAAAAQFCHDDSRCKAGIDLDGAPHGSVIQTGLRQPFMFLLSDHGQEADAASNQIRADIDSVYDRVPADRRVRATIRGAFHFTFSDDGAVMKSSLVRALLRLTGRLGISGRRQLAITAYCVRSFFDASLRVPPVADFTLATSQYPEIQVY